MSELKTRAMGENSAGGMLPSGYLATRSASVLLRACPAISASLSLAITKSNVSCGMAPSCLSLVKPLVRSVPKLETRCSSHQYT